MMTKDDTTALRFAATWALTLGILKLLVSVGMLLAVGSVYGEALQLTALEAFLTFTVGGVMIYWGWQIRNHHPATLRYLKYLTILCSISLVLAILAVQTAKIGIDIFAVAIFIRAYRKLRSSGEIQGETPPDHSSAEFSSVVDKNPSEQTSTIRATSGPQISWDFYSGYTKTGEERPSDPIKALPGTAEERSAWDNSQVYSRKSRDKSNEADSGEEKIRSDPMFSKETRTIHNLRLNRRQKIVLRLGVFLLVGSTLFPPWLESRTAYEGRGRSRIPVYDYVVSGGHSFILAPPYNAVGVDLSRLFVQWVIVIGGTLGLIYLWKRRDPKEHDESEWQRKQGDKRRGKINVAILLFTLAAFTVGVVVSASKMGLDAIQFS